MALSEIEHKQIEKAVESQLPRIQPPADVRDQFDIGYRISDQSVEILEKRRHWRNPEELVEIPVAKATYVKSRKIWKVYWKRSDLKWHLYDPDSTVNSISEFMNVVANDDFACFFG